MHMWSGSGQWPHNGKSSWQLLKKKKHLYWIKRERLQNRRFCFLLPFDSFHDHGCERTWQLKLKEPSYNHKVNTYRIRNKKIERTWVPNDMLEPLLQNLELPTSRILVIWDDQITPLTKPQWAEFSLCCSWSILTDMNPKLNHNTGSFQVSCLSFQSAYWLSDNVFHNTLILVFTYLIQIFIF